MKRSVPFLICISLFYGCASFSSERDFHSYIENPENGYVVEKRSGDFVFYAQLKPLEYILSKENYSEDVSSEEQNELGNAVYFTVRIFGQDERDLLKSGDGSTDEALYNYLAFEAEKDFYLVSGQDTTRCSGYLFEDDGGLSPGITLLLSYDFIPEYNSDFHLIYESRAFGNEVLTFSFNERLINNLSALK